MATESDLDKFARVEDGVIVEYPVYRLHITNRSHPLSWYTPVVEVNKPDVPEFGYLKETLTVKDGYIEATYEAIDYTLDELLSSLRRKAGIQLGGSEDITIADVDIATITQVYKLGGQYVTSLLNAFAQTRHYDGIDTLVSYLPSTFDKVRTEAARGFALRDACWKASIPYFDKVVAGVLPIPRSVADIDALLPMLTWEDEDTATTPATTPTTDTSSSSATAAPVATDTQADTAETLAAKAAAAEKAAADQAAADKAAQDAAAAAAATPSDTSTTTAPETPAASTSTETPAADATTTTTP